MVIQIFAVITFPLDPFINVALLHLLFTLQEERRRADGSLRGDEHPSIVGPLGVYIKHKSNIGKYKEGGRTDSAVFLLHKISFGLSFQVYRASFYASSVDSCLLKQVFSHRAMEE